MERVQVACRAMATRFEAVLEGDDAVRLRAAGEAALDEVRRWEARLSAFRPSSEVAQVNSRAARAPVPVSPPVFRLLRQAALFHELTGGAFDPTVGPLMRCWGFAGGTPRRPTEAALTEAHARTGFHRVHLDAARRTVAFARPGMALDPGAFGKGAALDEAATVLREAGVERALLHGGTSTVVGLARPDEPWRVAVPHPDSDAPPLAVVDLAGAALSVSAVTGRAFTEDGVAYGHVLDPRSGRPVRGALLAAVVAPSALATDALSTALLVLGRAGLNVLAGFDDVRALVVTPGPPPNVFHHHLPPES